MADLLGYLNEPGESNAWKHSFAEKIDKVNVNHFAKLWVVITIISYHDMHGIAQWRYYQGHEPGGINE